MKLVCEFSGWFTADSDDVQLVNPASGETMSATEWYKAGVDMGDLILDNFEAARGGSDDSAFVTLDLSIEED